MILRAYFTDELSPADFIRQFGACLRQARKRAGLTQIEVARRSGIVQTHLSRVETGRVNPSLELSARIAAAMGYSLIVTIKKHG
jgi:transcriptional regulator with XRE-family HTH domain